MAHAKHASHEFNEADPHGAGDHSSHVIIGPFQLRLVLAILLFFTAATVGFAQLEVWVEGLIGQTLPWWVNVVGAMSIAVVKSLLVMAIFMQLRYDNPINSIVMAFTFAALACFLVFTGLDLFNRGEVDAWKAPQVISGGTGMNVKNADGKPIVTAARERFMKKLEERHGKEAAAAKFEEIRGTVVHAHHAAHDDGASNANRSRPRTGLSDALSTAAPAAEGHGDSHAPSHAEPAATPASGH